jgi:hypothetical protein
MWRARLCLGVGLGDLRGHACLAIQEHDERLVEAHHVTAASHDVRHSLTLVLAWPVACGKTVDLVRQHTDDAGARAWGKWAP